MGRDTTPSLDHVFLASSRGAPEVEPLLAAGFTEGEPNEHHGQGTACRRFFFENAYLEFLWLEDRAEAGSPAISRTGLRERLGASGRASRIGVCLRLAGNRPEPPVATWSYQPRYLPPGLSIPMARNSVISEEPLLFFTPPGLARQGAKTSHRNGARRVSRIEIVLPLAAEPSAELAWLAGSGLIDLKRGAIEALGVELDHGAQGRRLAIAAASALVLTW